MSTETETETETERSSAINGIERSDWAASFRATLMESGLVEEFNKWYQPEPSSATASYEHLPVVRALSYNRTRAPVL